MWNLYVLLPAFLLCILAWILSELFAEICKEMERAFADGRDAGRIVQMSGVRHSLVCQAVWTLEAFFQNIMLVNVACSFTSCISFFVLILDELGRGRFATAVVFLLGGLTRFVILEAVGHFAVRLKHKVLIVSQIVLCKFLINLCKLSLSKADTIHQCLIKSNLLYMGNEPDQVIPI